MLAAASALTLEAAVEEAMSRHETPALAAEQVVRARAARQRALAAWFPTAVLTTSYTRRGPIDDASQFRRRDAVNGAMQFRSRLFDATQITDLSAAGARVERDETDAEFQVRTFRFEVADAFFTVLVAERSADAALQRVDLAEQVLAEVSDRFEAGLAGLNDRSRQELELASARLARTVADNAVRQARLALGFLLSRSVDEPLEAPGAMLVDGTEDVQDLFEQALELRPDLASLQAELRAQRQDALEPLMRLVPFIDAEARLVLTNESGFAGEAFSWNLGLVATWELFDGGFRYADLQEQRSLQATSQLELRQLERSARLEIEQAQADRVAARAAVDQASDRLRVAQLNYDEVRERYQGGLATAIEQADASVQLFEARVLLEQARFENRIAELAVLEATGAPLPVGDPGR